MSWSTSELSVRLAPWNWFKPSSKIVYWPFQGGASFVDLLCFFLSCVCYAFVRICLYVPCGHLLGKSWPLVSNCVLSLSHWYPGSGVVLDCIDSWSLHRYLLRRIQIKILSLDRKKIANVPCSFNIHRSLALKWSFCPLKMKVLVYVHGNDKGHCISEYLPNAAAVQWAIIKPELRPPSGVRNAGSSLYATI